MSKKLKRKVTLDNSASIDVSINIKFNRTDIPKYELERMSLEMQEILDECTKNFYKELGIDTYRKGDTFVSSEIKAIGKICGKEFSSLLEDVGGSKDE